MATRLIKQLLLIGFFLTVPVTYAETGVNDKREPVAGSSEVLSASSPSASTLLQVDGNVSATSFTGDGSTLTNLSPDNLSVGTAAISITGSAVSSSDINCTNCVSESELNFDPATQGELDTHVNGNPSAHHAPTTYTAGPGLALAGTQLRLSGFSDVPSNFSISALEGIGDPYSGISITVGSDGLGLISYMDYPSGDLKVAHCNDTICSSAEIHTLLTGGFTSSSCCSTSITIGSDGLGLISFWDANITTSALDLKVAHCEDIHCTAAVIHTLDDTGIVGLDSSITIGTDGLGLISYRDSTNGTLKAAHCDDVLCSSASTYQLNLGGGGSSITIDAFGRGLISHVSNDQLLVTKCIDVLCSNAGTFALEGMTMVRGKTEIITGPDGLPLVLYKEEFAESEYRLGIAHCTINCGTNTASIVDQGYDGSITIGADGFALVSYLRAFPPFDIWVAHCIDFDCSESTKVATGVSSNGGISLTRGADALPLIGTFDPPDLKVIHCSNNFCIPYFRRR